MLKKTYDWMMRAAAQPNATPTLAAVSFAESSFFPLPPDIMLLPMVLANRAKAWWYATVTTVSSVLGGIAGYAIGFYLFGVIGEPILNFYGLTEKFTEVTTRFNQNGVWVILAKGLTPIPFKLVTITAGAVHMQFVPFVLASIVARAIRFYPVAALLYFFGPPIRDFVEKRLVLVTSLFVLLIVGGFVAVKFIHIPV